MNFSDWWGTVSGSVPLATVTLLTLAVIFVNGWTDAPNAIATCVATRALSPEKAIALAAVMNFLGLAVSTSVSSTVSDTVCSMVDFGSDRERGRIALCAALAGVVIWSVIAWRFGIPTSESHALLSGLSGAAAALQGGEGIRGSIWCRILIGLLFSVFGSAVLGAGISIVLRLVGRRLRRRAAERRFGFCQILAAAANSALHGAQDGQKFLGVLLLSVLTLPEGVTAEAKPWMIGGCCAVLTLGTSLGGVRILRAVGVKMVKPERDQGFSADLASAVCLLICTALGFPVSTTHAKTSAMIGVGAARRLRAVNWIVAGQMVIAWIVTFPICGLFGYVFSRIFLRIF